MTPPILKLILGLESSLPILQEVAMLSQLTIHQTTTQFRLREPLQLRNIRLSTTSMIGRVVRTKCMTKGGKIVEGFSCRAFP